MSAGFTFSACSLFYSVLLTIMYFSKKRLNALENKIYSWLILSNLGGIILALVCYYTILNMEVVPILNIVVSKALLIYYLIWISIFTIYVFVVSYNIQNKSEADKHQHFRKICKIFFILFVLIAIPVWCLPLHFFRDGSVVYSYGPGANLLYIVIPLYITGFLIYMVKNLKTLTNRKYLPLFVFIFFGTVVMVIQKMNPGLLLMTSMETFITFLMFFTIENPDLKMIEELHKAKNLSEKYNNDKSIFMFNLSQQMRGPLSNIEQLSEQMIDSKNQQLITDNVVAINELSSRLLSIINTAFDISTIDSKKLKTYENQYSISLLLNEVILKNKPEIQNKNLEFRKIIDEGLPDLLYGDPIKIKQILNALVSNAIKYTPSGFIELSVNSVVKYDVCRLIINIEDSGVGIKHEDVDKMFYKNKDDIDIDIDNLRAENIALKDIKKMVNTIGGTIMVKSNKGKGSVFTIILDQKIVEVDKNKTLKDFERYKKIQLDKLNIMVVDDDPKELETISKKIANDKVNIVAVNGGQVCLERIRNHEKYDLILINDVLSKLSSSDTLNKLKKIDGFVAPVIIMSDSYEDITRNMYLEMGFQAILSKPVKKKDFEKLLSTLTKK